ncbi:MAG: hypothetical protein C0507_00185 [Cyanobacteria bacterium PR.3.49]|nr:hypothetical protein [Cyanobacteria bacterium PR.3.49]
MSKKLQHEKTGKRDTLAKRGFQPYLGTVQTPPRQVGDVPFGPEPGSGLDMTPDPNNKGIVRHKDCGAYTVVKRIAEQEGKPHEFVCFGCKQTVRHERILQYPGNPNHFELFGDESTAGPFSLYGILILKDVEAREAEAALSEFLEGATGIEGARLHCKEVFHESSRANTAFKDFTKEEIWEIAEQLIVKTRDFMPSYKIGAAHRNTYPQFVPGSNPQQKLTAEHLYPPAFMGAVALLKEDGLSHKDFSRRFRIDAQKNKLEFWGMGRAQVQTLLNEVNLKTEPVSVDKPILFDAIDIVLYAYGHLLLDKAESQEKKILEIAKPVVAQVTWRPDDEKRPYSIGKTEGIPALYPAT